MKKSIVFLIGEIALLIIVMSLGKAFFISGVSIVLHEMAHIICARLYGCKLYKFSVSLTGANAKINDIDDLKDFQKFNLYMSGPIVNLLIVLICSWVLCVKEVTLLREIGRVNFCLFIFNMIPAYPLDGARLLEIILSKIFTYRKSKKIIGVISLLFSGILVIGGGYTLFYNPNISLFLMAGIIVYSSYMEKKFTIYIMMSDLFRKGRLIEKYEYIDNRNISISYKNSLLNILRMVDKNKFNSFYILDEEVKLMGIMHEDELLEALKTYGNITIEEYLINKAEKNS